MVELGKLEEAYHSQKSEFEPPNVVVILVDDMGWRDLNCTGSGFYQTPHIDRLAEKGMSFTRAQSACMICSPSRASILSGQYPARHKMR